MKKPTRPLTEEQRQRATIMLAAGMTRSSAAKFAGCRRADLDLEIQSNPEFKKRVGQSELQPELSAMRRVVDTVREPGQWRAAAWMLERLYPQRYAPGRRDGVPPKALKKVMEDCANEQQANSVRKQGAAKAKHAGGKKKPRTHAKARSTATKKSSAKRQ